MAAAAFAVVGSGAPAMAGQPQARAAQEKGDLAPAGAPIVRKVSPRRSFRIRIPRVGTLSGARGSVSRRATIVIVPYRARLAGGLHAAGLGVDVALRGATLRRRLTLTQRVRRTPKGMVPLVAHRADDGSWDVRPGRLVRGRHIRVVTKRFSVNIPAWLDPREWARALGDRLAASIGGRTSPWTCPTPPPGWFDVINRTSTVHACAAANPDAAGERGEVRIKSNRGAVLQVTLAGPRDYAWVDGQPDKLRALLGRATGTDPGNVVFLPKGDDGLMTVGYRRPAAPADYTLLVETTYDSLAVNLVYLALDAAAQDVAPKVRFGLAGYMLSKCSDVLNLSSGTVKSPHDALSGAVFTEALSCVIETAAETLKDRKKAFAAALEIHDPAIHKMTTQQFADELTKTARGLKAFERLLFFRPILQQGWQGAADTIAALLTDGESTHVDVHLAGRSEPAQSPPPAEPQPQPQPQPQPNEREVVIYNKVTNDGSTMREDTPAYLSTVTQNYCKRDGCALPGTDMNSGFRIVALCQTTGARTTNGWDGNSVDDGNPGLYESTRWYRMRWSDGRTGYLSEVWVEPGYRGGMGLPAC